MRAPGGGQASTEGVGKRVENPEENVPTYTPAHRGFVKEKGSFFAHGATRLFRGGVERGPPGEAFPGGELSPNSVNINLQFS